jgi:hypothetical protein
LLVAVPVPSFRVRNIVFVDSKEARAMENGKQWSPFLYHTLIRASAGDEDRYLKEDIDVLVREKSRRDL